jgi:hypothetical protein
MQKTRTHWTLALALAAGCMASPALAAETNGSAGAVEQTIPPPVSQNVKLPPLHLTDQQRGKVRDALKTDYSQADFHMKKAKNFKPSVGAKLPEGAKPKSLPQPLLSEVPALRDYAFARFNDQILIVNPMTKTIVDQFPQG